MSKHQESDDYPIEESRLEPLQERQRSIYSVKLSQFADYLRTEGKDPMKEKGYSNASVQPRLSRFHRAVAWIWEQEKPTTEFTPSDGQTVLEALNQDAMRKEDGGRYAEGSKRKIKDVLDNWFAFEDESWDPNISFSDEPAADSADPFHRGELRDLWQAALTFKSIPNYNNISPTERERWKSYIAQELGKPKSNVRPKDWDDINHDWKIPSIIRTSRSAGWRPAMVGRLRVDWYDPSQQVIRIPKGEAVKNDARWEQNLSHEGSVALEKWLEQRANNELYDDRERIWLNRKGNPYDSGPLNDILRDLMDAAGINPRGRKLVWYSFRHSIGTYVYEKYKDLSIVAQTLRQKSTASAERYVHPTNELKSEVAELL